MLWPQISRSIIFELKPLSRENVETLTSIGCKVESISSLGGGASSPLWLQMKADLLQVPIQLPSCKEVTSLGAAMLAHGGDCSGMCRMERTIQPGKPLYEESYARYKELNKLLLPTF